MIYDSSSLPLPLRLRADLCVVGSGAGGSMVALAAAEAGLKVVVLEAGEFLAPTDMSQREEQMFPRLYWDAGGRSTSDRAVRIHQGHGVGGSTLHNINLCKRIPASIRAHWDKERKLEHLGPEQWDKLYTEVEKLLSVEEIPQDRHNLHNRLMAKACKKLGWRGATLKHNRTGCAQSGFCEVGCAYDGKNNAAKVVIPRAVKAGAEVLSLCQAVEVLHDGKRTSGVKAVALDLRTRRPLGEVHIEASQICLSASGTGTPALLQRSGVADPGGHVGRSLRIHPGVMVAGLFDERIEAWRGVPQTYECTEWLELDPAAGDKKRVWIIPAFAHPMGSASMVPGHGAAHRRIMESYPRLGVFSAMVHDDTKGSVEPKGDLGLSIDYWPDRSDREQLARGLWACAKLLVAAGAREIIVPTSEPRSYRPSDNFDDLLKLDIQRGQIDVTAVHPMSSVPMGDDRTKAAVGSNGKHHHLEGLWIADGSLFPTSIGIPPQLSIYALGLHVGRAIAR